MDTVVRPHIGIVEDNEDLREEFEFQLRARGYIVWSAARVETFLRQVQVARTDVALIDLTLPDEDGLELVRQLHKDRTRGLIVVTARGDLRTKLEAMQLGADHFLVKPVDLQELLVTIEATWRRSQGAAEMPTDTSGQRAAPSCWSFDPLDRTLGEPTQGTLELSSTECTLLGLLTSRAGELVTKEQILAAVYPGDPSCEFHRIEVVLNRLRQKARRQDIALPIRSVFGKGLVFAAECRRSNSMSRRTHASPHSKG